MKTLETIAGNVYCVTSKNGGTLTDATGTLSEPIEAGKQVHVTAPSDRLIIDDDEAILRPANFKKAPLMLGTQGGGSANLAGFISAYFLQDDGSQYLATDVKPTNETGILLDAQPLTDTDTIPMGCRENATTDSRFFAVRPRRERPDKNQLVNNGFGWGTWKVFEPANLSSREVVREKTLLNWQNNRKAVTPYASQNLSTLPFIPTLPMYIFAANVAGAASLNYNGRIWRVGISQGDKITHNYVPAIAYDGRPCMVDTMSPSVLANRGASEFIVGFTLKQARLLGQLPAGSSFRVALPSGWQEDEGVAAAKAQAEANGCVLPVQEYTEEASSAATYALRRIWVRLAQENNGSYIDAGGTRWNMDWCVEVWGADPESLGYELFRSVEAAAEYWGLTPYETIEEL